MCLTDIDATTGKIGIGRYSPFDSRHYTERLHKLGIVAPGPKVFRFDEWKEVEMIPYTTGQTHATGAPNLVVVVSLDYRVKYLDFRVLGVSSPIVYADR